MVNAREPQRVTTNNYKQKGDGNVHQENVEVDGVDLAKLPGESSCVRLVVVLACLMYCFQSSVRLSIEEAPSVTTIAMIMVSVSLVWRNNV